MKLDINDRQISISCTYKKKRKEKTQKRGMKLNVQQREQRPNEKRENWKIGLDHSSW
jgi:hypothetical protein